MVNDQLDQLYVDLELQGESSRISIGDTPSSSSEDEENLTDTKNIHLILIHEENANAPLPPPLYTEI